MVINIGDIKSGRFDRVLEEISLLKKRRAAISSR
jgi:deoxyribose-phosphate aldolase